jgi:hypothetical protein
LRQSFYFGAGEKKAKSALVQGCQMVYSQNKNPNLGKFWRALDGEMLLKFMAIGNILQTFRIFHDHLVHFMFIWYIFPKNLATLLWSATSLQQKLFFRGADQMKSCAGIYAQNVWRTVGITKHFLEHG